MDERLKTALDQVRAEESLKARTRDYLARRTRGYRPRPARVRPLVPALACLLVLLAALGGWRAYFTPTVAISIDVNPSIELEINRFDKVIGVEGYNDDGTALAQTLEVRFLDYADALDAVLASQVIADCLARGEALSIAVAGSDEVQSSAVLAQVESCTAGHENIHCHGGTIQEAEQAHEAGLSLGRYQAYLALRELDPTVTPEEVQDMTMREIRERISALSAGGEAAPQQVTEQEHEHGGSYTEAPHGQGHGYGRQG